MGKKKELFNVLSDQRLTSATSADEPKIVELGHLVLHQSRRVSQLSTAVLVVTSTNGDQSAIADFAKSHHLEGYWKGLVGPPVSWQHAADQVRRTCNRIKHTESRD